MLFLLRTGLEEERDTGTVEVGYRDSGRRKQMLYSGGGCGAGIFFLKPNTNIL